MFKKLHDGMHSISIWIVSNFDDHSKHQIGKRSLKGSRSIGVLNHIAVSLDTRTKTKTDESRMNQNCSCELRMHYSHSDHRVISSDNLNHLAIYRSALSDDRDSEIDNNGNDNISFPADQSTNCQRQNLDVKLRGKMQSSLVDGNLYPSDSDNDYDASNVWSATEMENNNCDPCRKINHKNRKKNSLAKIRLGFSSLFKSSREKQGGGIDHQQQQDFGNTPSSKALTARTLNGSGFSLTDENFSMNSCCSTAPDSSSNFYKINVSREEFTSTLNEMNRKHSAASPDGFNNKDFYGSHINASYIDMDNQDYFLPDDIDNSNSASNKCKTYDDLNVVLLSSDKCNLMNNQGSGKADTCSVHQIKEIKESTKTVIDKQSKLDKSKSISISARISSKLSMGFKKRLKYADLRLSKDEENILSMQDSRSLTDLGSHRIDKFLNDDFMRSFMHRTSEQITEPGLNFLRYEANQKAWQDHSTVSRKERPKSDHLSNNCNASRFHADPIGKANQPSRSLFGRKENYETLEKLGEGSYATVYKGRHLIDGTVVALKEIKINAEEGCPFTAIREASLLKGLKHANIVLLHDIIYVKDCLTFVFELVHRDLSQYMEKHPSGIHPHNAKIFLFQLLRGLAYCHEKKILHRDMKPQNLLISEIGELKLADFGLARATSVPSHSYSHEVVTLWYRPPDVLLGSTEYSTSLDMWGVGCIFAEMLTGCALFPGAKDAFDQLDKIFRVMGMQSEETWEKFKRSPNRVPSLFRLYPAKRPLRIHRRINAIHNCEPLLASFLQLEPEKRISAKSAMRHAYFDDLPDEVHCLSHISSIFTVPGVRLVPEPILRPSLPLLNRTNHFSSSAL